VDLFYAALAKPDHTENREDMTTAAAAVAAPSTPHLHRLEQLESPNSRYAGRRVAHIDTPTAQLAAPSASSLLSPKPPKHSRSLAFAASPPLVKRSRSAEQSDDDAVDDDEFLLSVAQENAAARRDVDDVVSGKTVVFLFF
jgi:hypothetical protein